MTYRIVVSDPLEKTGLAMLRESGHDVVEVSAEDKPRLPELLAEADALVVRSGTRVTADLLSAGSKLRVVGRAGIGVDNVDIPAATERGVLVVNAPTANLISATEHTFALLLAAARNVASADAAMRREEWNRKAYVGTELQGKTLGVIGFGRIGQAVARRARAFDMEILAYDPFLDADQVRRADARPLELDELLAEADVVTLHVPLTDATRNLLTGDRLRRMKQGAILINCARGGTVDEATLLELLESGHLAAAGLDVFAEEPPTDWRLATHPRVVSTPHLGAQTREAQVRISTQTARMVLAALDGSLAVTAVNLPFRPAGTAGEPWLRLAERLGRIAGALLGSGPRHLQVTLQSIADALHPSVAVAALKGALVPSLGEAVNYVNAESLARERGIELVRSASEAASPWPSVVRVRAVGPEGEVEIAGTLFQDGEPRVVELDGYPLEFRPNRHVLLLRNRDVPGVVGRLGTVLGEAGVNIAEIHLARRPNSDRAVAVVRVDQRPDDATLQRILDVDEIERADRIDLSDA
ncbi:MAG: phosphoglycerate dehydrogenase [Acidobacteriota bacterium]